MASMAFHLRNQLVTTGKMKLFCGSHGYGDGEQRRDFVHVDDTVAVNLWLFDHSDVSGIYNCGTGQSATFNEVARAVIECYGRGTIEYIPFPEDLQGFYQSFTEADLTALREAGYDGTFMSVKEGIPSYVQWLDAHMSS
jgi:ADP-L-glycero-D-manno-heptose 6-epimerase